MYMDYGYSEEDKLGKPYDFRLLKRLYPFAKPYSGMLFIAIVLVILITVLDLSIPYLSKIAIDRYIVPRSDSLGSKSKIRYLTVDTTKPEIRAIIETYPTKFRQENSNAVIAYDELGSLDPADLKRLRSNDLEGIGIVAAVFMVVIILSFASHFFQVVVLEYTAQRIMHDLRMRLFCHIQNLSAAFFTRNPVARLVTRVTNDIQNMDELFNSVVVFVFKDVFLLVGIAGVLISLNRNLAFVSFSFVPLVVLSSAYFSNHARDAFRVLRIKTAEINTRFSETISGIRVIQLFLQECSNYNRFETVNHEYYEAGVKQVRIFAVFMPIVELFGSVTVAAVIWYGGRDVLEAHITLGELTAFISYMKMFFTPIRDIAEKYNIMQNAMASAERIFLILDSEEYLPEVEETVMESIQTEPLQEVAWNNVTFAYIPGEPVLHSVSFTVRAGTTAAIVGPTGSGKTSLISLMIRFYDPISGSVTINGRDIRTLSRQSLRSKMALVTQDPFLFSASVRENIFHTSGQIPEEEIHRVLELSNCRELIDKLPDGLDTVLSEGGASISSGERQLISIARAFAKNPELILLDEATSYIDSETEARIQLALANLMRHRTSIIVAHRLSTARYADRILVLNRGRAIESGTHEELMKLNGFYFRLNQVNSGSH